MPGWPDRRTACIKSEAASRLQGDSAILSIRTEATAAGIDGLVSAEITVNEQGIVTDARVLNSNPVLDDAALKAVRGMALRPDHHRRQSRAGEDDRHG